ncbi:MAG: DUF1700 domain-containing protein, partial [candidate division Zixibacteria bacterium]|nr:DUF1700 domain-containing protein [candidate division Zixibacteria bacterium]
MKELSPEANILLEDYLRKLKEVLRPLPEKEREEIVLEIEGHIEERLAQFLKEGNETDVLKNILNRLGKPEECASEFVTDYLLSKGMEQRSVIKIIKGLLRWGCSTLIGFFYALFFFVSYLVSISFVFIGIMKPIFPESVSLFLKEGSLEGFGFFTGASFDPNTQEILGYWVIPISLFTGIVWFLVTNRLL